MVLGISQFLTPAITVDWYFVSAFVPKDQQFTSNLEGKYATAGLLVLSLSLSRLISLVYAHTWMA